MPVSCFKDIQLSALEAGYDSPFSLFSKQSCLQLLSSNMCNFFFSIKSSISCVLLLPVLLPNIYFPPIHHAAIQHAVHTQETNGIFETLNCE